MERQTCIGTENAENAPRSCNALELWGEFLSSKHGGCSVVMSNNFFAEMTSFLSQKLNDLYKEKRKKTFDEQLSNMEKFLVCENCDDIFVNPVTLLCGHSYCKNCLKKREEQNFIETCSKCDKQNLKLGVLSFVKRNAVDTLHKNVALNTVISEIFHTELQATVVRLQGNELLLNGDVKNAEEKYVAATQKGSSNFQSWSNLSQVQLKQNKFEEALISAQRVIHIAPSWSKGYYREAFAYKMLSKPYESSLSFFKYLILEPYSYFVKERMVECLIQLMTTQPHLRALNEVIEGYEEEMFSFSIKNVDKQSIRYMETLMLHLLTSGIEFCLLQPPGVCRFPPRNLSQESLDNLKDCLSCSLCGRVFYEPTTIWCGHTFCTKCLERSMDFNNTCAICRTNLDDFIAIRPKPIDHCTAAMVQYFFHSDHKENETSALENAEVLKFENVDTGDIANIPIFICMPVFPTIQCPLHVFEPKYKLMIRRSMESSMKVFGMCMLNEVKGFSDYGTLLEIQDSKLLPDGRLLINTIGGKRFKVLERSSCDGYPTAKVQFLVDVKSEHGTEELKQLMKEVYMESKSFFMAVPPAFLEAVRIKFGELPAFVDGGEENNGTTWEWYMLRLLIQQVETDISAILGCLSRKHRLLQIRENLKRMPTLSQRR